MDPNNVLQTVQYVSDALGFRVAATNLPDDGSPQVDQSYVSPYYAPYAPSYQYLIPSTAPKIAPTIEEDIRQQKDGFNEQAKTFYHQSLDQNSYQFGYAADSAERTEARDVNGVITGSYNYLDPEGISQTVRYKADENGFQVKNITNTEI